LRAFALLAQGEFSDGFAEYEWRARLHRGIGNDSQIEPKSPAWDGSDPAGRTIYIRAEQGFGDLIQFCRFVPMLADRGATVLVECPPTRARLLRSLRDVHQVITNRLPWPACDLYADIGSLPALFKATLQSLPADVPYLHPDPERIVIWKQRIAPHRAKLNVG